VPLLSTISFPPPHLCTLVPLFSTISSPPHLRNLEPRIPPHPLQFRHSRHDSSTTKSAKI
jgi:hypothetical protein